MSHRIRRLSVIDQTVTLFRDILQKAGVQPSAYHVPDWEETPAGLEKLLDETFRVTPPTALVCWTMGPVNGVLGWWLGMVCTFRAMFPWFPSARTRPRVGFIQV